MIFLVRVLLVLVLLGAIAQFASKAAASSAEPAASLRMESPSFQPNAAIPTRFSCDGQNISPALQWQSPPRGTRGLALILRDPDAPSGVFIHWLIYNLPPTLRGLPEGAVKQPELPDGSRQGRNSARSIGYTGPCPPPGSVHRYIFTLYALDAQISLPAGASEPELVKAMQGHVLATGQLMGRFQH
jgi:hypothetical protein